MHLPKRQQYKKASDEQRHAFGQSHDRMSARFFTIDKSSTLMRDYYRRGQRLFRACVDQAWSTNSIDTVNDLVQGLNDTQREGFLMGWQSDCYAFEHGLEFSVEGGDSEAVAHLSRTFR